MLQGGLGPEEVQELQEELATLNAKLAQLEQGLRDKDTSIEAGQEALEVAKQRLSTLKLDNKQLKAKVPDSQHTMTTAHCRLDSSMQHASVYAYSNGACRC